MSRRTAEGRDEVRDPRCVGNKVFLVDNDSFGERSLVDHFIRILLLLRRLFFLPCVKKEKNTMVRSARATSKLKSKTARLHCEFTALFFFFFLTANRLLVKICSIHMVSKGLQTH